MNTHTKKKPHKCQLCPAAFGEKIYLKQHMKGIHGGNKHIRNKNIHCPMCSYICHHNNILKIHMRKHFSELPFTCDLPDCDFRTKFKCNLSRHAILAHSDESPFKCPSDGCSYRTKTREHLKRHVKVHSNDKPFACEVRGCSYTCKTKVYLKVHISSVHRDDRPFKCSTCDFTTKTSKRLKQHQFVHMKSKRFQCPTPNCSYASHQKEHLERHCDSKHRNKDVFCTEPGCNFRCGSTALLKTHLKWHEKTELKCPGDSCGYSTKNKNNLLRHISSRHEDLQSSATVVVMPTTSDLETVGGTKTLHCSFTDCDFRTKFRHDYDSHVITHSKGKNQRHVCKFCFSRFCDLDKLRVHIWTHTGEKPYRCSHCKYTYVKCFELEKHAKRTHSIHVIPCGEEDELRKCHTCGRNCFSNTELVVHSMSHLNPVVVLSRLNANFL